VCARSWCWGCDRLREDLGRNLKNLHEELHEEFVLNWIQVFCKIVRNVVGRFNVGDSKLALSFAVADPVEALIILHNIMLYTI
jgi:hypothetical protein